MLMMSWVVLQAIGVGGKLAATRSCEEARKDSDASHKYYVLLILFLSFIVYIYPHLIV